MVQTESNIETPFKHYWQVIAFINNNNPARAKYRNLIEPDRASNKIVDDFTGESPKDIFASITIGIQRRLAKFPHEWRLCWALKNIGARDKQPHVLDLVPLFGKSKQTIYRWLNTIDEDLTREFVFRRLIPPLEEGE